MKILKAIGAFFARIWRWIKETAWVQPLLIVGAIFAIIFAFEPVDILFPVFGSHIDLPFFLSKSILYSNIILFHTSRFTHI